jgi:hypothetical protein
MYIESNMLHSLYRKLDRSEKIIDNYSADHIHISM